MKIKDYLKKYGPASQFIRRWKEDFGRHALPWNRAYHNIRQRCRSKTARKFSYYGGRNIRCELSPSDLRAAFFKDRAYRLEQPSIDRINPDKDYTPDNVRWIEMEQNRKWSGINHPERFVVFKQIKAIVFTQFKKHGWPLYLQRLCLSRIRKEITP